MKIMNHLERNLIARRLESANLIKQLKSTQKSGLPFPYTREMKYSLLNSK